MGETTKIAWVQSADGTPGSSWSPWIGCQKVSAGCEHCYAEAMERRWGHNTFGPNGVRRVTSDAHWRLPLKWAKQARAEGKRRSVFPSMCDVFEDRPELVEPRVRLAALIRETADALDWMLLTKRPENFGLMPPDVLALCWGGVTGENQKALDTRVPLLLAARFRMRFVSMEPLLESVDLTHTGALGCDCWPLEFDDGTIEERCSGHCAFYRSACAHGGPGRRVDWVIVGGESGPRRRPCDNAWVRGIVRQCREAGVPAFVKQLQVGPRRVVVTDPALFTEDLRVREMPEVQP